MASINAKVKLRIDTEANWTSSNPTLLAGEVAISSDQLHAGTDQPKFKIGNGADAWTALDYYPVSGAGSSTWGSITGTLSDQTDLQNALNAKQNTITTGTTAQYFRGDLSLATLDKTAVGLGNVTNDAQLKIASNLSDLNNAATARTNLGLGNVDNTSDANKPVSTAQQTAINAAINKLNTYNYTPYTLASSTSELVTHSIQISGGVSANDILEVYSSCVTNSSAGTKTFRMYIHTSAGTPGSAPPAGTLVATSATITTTTANSLSRVFPVLSTTSIRVHGGTTGTFGSQYGASAVTSATVAVPDLSSTFHIIITAQKGTAGDTATTDYTYVKIHKA